MELEAIEHRRFGYLGLVEIFFGGAFATVAQDGGFGVMVDGRDPLLAPASIKKYWQLLPVFELCSVSGSRCLCSLQFALLSGFLPFPLS